ncbi:MAG: hypothetical protein JRJ84_12335 [Deltaproteobacteria bacterium]|nr:hypothetical protein [Deltaproteobacteria bacterium]
MPKLGKHSSDQAIAALGDCDLHPRIALAGPIEHPDPGGLRPPVVQVHTLFQGAKVFRPWRPVHLGQVPFGNIARGMGEEVRQVPVVCEQECPLRIEVEAAHGLDLLTPVPQQIEDALALLRIVPAGDAAAWLVHQEVHRRGRRRKRLVVHPDVVRFWVDEEGGVVDDLPVHHHPT